MSEKAIYIALLRGINVGGKQTLPMKELRFVLEELGLQDVKTYIQSGNVTFKYAESQPDRLEGKISAAVKQARGFEPAIMILTLQEFRAAVASNPYPEAASTPKYLHFGFLSESPQNPDLESLNRLRTPSEEYKLIGRVFYLHVPDGLGTSKMARSIERFLKVPMTMRNWRTVSKILALAETQT